MGDSSKELVTSSEIAHLAEVSRAAVSNWRRRYPDFPKPAGGTTASPLFPLAQIEQWLRETGKAGQLRTDGVTKTGTQRVERARPDRATGKPAEGSSPALGKVWEASVERLVPPRVKPVWLRAEDLSASWIDEPASEELDGIVSIVPFSDPEWTRRARDLASDGRWEFGTPGPRDVQLAWVQNVYAKLKDGGSGVVALSAGAAVSESGRQVRASMVRAGVLDAVIALGTAAVRLLNPLHSGVELQLWLLRKDRGAVARRLLMVDLHEMALDALPQDHQGWREVFADPRFSCEVEAIDLLGEHVELLPAQWVRPSRRGLLETYRQDASSLSTLLADASRRVPRLGESAEAAGFHPMVSLGELERSGALKFLKRGEEPTAGDVLLHPLTKALTVATGAPSDNEPVRQVITLDRDLYDPHFVAVFLRPETARLSASSGYLPWPSKDLLRRCRIPRMPINQQRRYSATVRGFLELEAQLHTAVEYGHRLIDEAVEGLVAGALAPAEPTVGTRDEEA